MNEIEKIGMYSTDEILEFMTEGEGRDFLGRSMFDAMYFKINNLQSKIDKANEILDKWGEEPDADMYMQIKEYKEWKELKDILKDDK